MSKTVVQGMPSAMMNLPTRNALPGRIHALSFSACFGYSVAQEKVCKATATSRDRRNATHEWEYQSVNADANTVKADHSEK